jgi:aryl sulfotransferase
MGTQCASAKTRELRNHHFDSTVWNDFQFRDDDIVIASYAKAGTTWTQQIIAQLLFGGDPNVEIAAISPWLDLRITPKADMLSSVESQHHRRFLKTHLPVNALVFSARAKYVYVGRDARDIVWSLHHHHASANAFWYGALNHVPGRIGPAIGPPPNDIRAYWLDWLEKDGHPFWPFWENVRTWWAVRVLPNVLLVHYDALKRDLPHEIRRIAAFLDIPIDEACWDDIVEHSTFGWMKRNAAKCAPMGGSVWNGGAQTFINKGVNGRWKSVLTREDIEAYETRSVRELGNACANWLTTGKRWLVEP